jgi:outer membrane protein assembly factor BamD
MLASMRRILLVAIAATLPWTGCGDKKPLSADQYYNEAESHMRDGAYPLAIESYRELLDQHPFSEHTEEAELRIGVAHYENNACPEAIAAFSDFQRRHPTSPYLSLVGYLIGECHERQMQIPTRDQSAAQNAHAYFQAVMQQYPESPFADLAQQRLARCRENLADHEFSIAEFYRQRGNDAAERTRLIDMIRRFNDTDRAAEALYRLGELYEERGDENKALLAYSALLYHHADHDLAEKSEEKVNELAAGSETPIGDPLAALEAVSGRSRQLDIVNRDPNRTTPDAADARPQVGFNRPNRSLDGLGSSRPGSRY